jgi:hypothetical protein
MTLFIDVFQKKSLVEDGVYVLTHAHLDHMTIPKSFSKKIYCSPVTHKLLEKLRPGIKSEPLLVPNRWCTLENKIHLFVFDSNHCVGSIGFYYEGHLYFGNGRPTYIQHLLFQLQDVVADIRFVHFDDFAASKRFWDPPLPKQSTQWIKDFMLQKLDHYDQIEISLPHFGALQHLPKGFHYRLDPSLPLIYSVVAELLAMHLSCESKISVVHKSRTQSNRRFFYLLVSARWWLHSTQVAAFDPIFVKKNVVRICLCAHATPQENDQVLDLLRKK